MEISDSPYRPGTPEHNQWVRQVFIPTAGLTRFHEDASKAGAAAIGRKLIDGRFDGEVSASGYARRWPPPASPSAGTYKSFTDKVMNMTLTFKDLNASMMQVLGFSDDEIRAAEERERREQQAAQWTHVPGWQWMYLNDDVRRGLGKVIVHGRAERPPRGGITFLTDEDGCSYYENGELLPQYGPARPDNRAQRRIRTRPPLRPQRECPRHGGPASACRICLRSHHARS